MSVKLDAIQSEIDTIEPNKREESLSGSKMGISGRVVVWLGNMCSRIYSIVCLCLNKIKSMFNRGTDKIEETEWTLTQIVAGVESAQASLEDPLKFQRQFQLLPPNIQQGLFQTTIYALIDPQCPLLRPGKKNRQVQTEEELVALAKEVLLNPTNETYVSKPVFQKYLSPLKQAGF